MKQTKMNRRQILSLAGGGLAAAGAGPALAQSFTGEI